MWTGQCGYRCPPGPATRGAGPVASEGRAPPPRARACVPGVSTRVGPTPSALGEAREQLGLLWPRGVLTSLPFDINVVCKSRVTVFSDIFV